MVTMNTALFTSLVRIVNRRWYLPAYRQHNGKYRYPGIHIGPIYTGNRLLAIL